MTLDEQELGRHLSQVFRSVTDCLQVKLYLWTEIIPVPSEDMFKLQDIVILPNPPKSKMIYQV